MKVLQGSKNFRQGRGERGRRGRRGGEMGGELQGLPDVSKESSLNGSVEEDVERGSEAVDVSVL